MNIELLLVISLPIGLFLVALYTFLKGQRQTRAILLYPPPRGTKWEINTDYLPGTIELRLMRRFPLAGEIEHVAVYATSNEELTDREVWNCSKRIAEEHEDRRRKIRITETPPQ